MSYSSFHETSNFCPGTVEKGARTARSRAALQRCLRDASLPDPFGQRPRTVSPEDSRKPRMRLPNGAQCHPSLQRARPRRPRPRLLATQARPRRFRRERRRGLRQMLHRSPREFGRNSSLWTLDMAAEVAFEEGLTEERVSGETIRATLWRLLSVRWMRAKRWITSPDPLYERKKAARPADGDLCLPSGVGHRFRGRVLVEPGGPAHPERLERGRRVLAPRPTVGRKRRSRAEGYILLRALCAPTRRGDVAEVRRGQAGEFHNHSVS